jgi:hypothetical protein
MKQIIEAYTREDGVVEPAHEVEVVCTHCKDPVSQEEENTGLCTNCSQPWAVQQSVNVFATTFPAIDGMTIRIG